MEKSKDWKKFLELILSAKDAGTLDTYFQLFTTHNEREMLVDRYRLVRAILTTDLSQREIADTLHLSISKVTAGSKALQSLERDHKNNLTKNLH